MKQFKMSITNGSLKAPSMIVLANDEHKAEQEAKSISGLGRFNSWVFTAVEMKQFIKSKNK